MEAIDATREFCALPYWWNAGSGSLSLPAFIRVFDPSSILTPLPRCSASIWIEATTCGSWKHRTGNRVKLWQMSLMARRGFPQAHRNGRM